MLRPSLLLVVFAAVWVVPVSGAVARGKTSVAAWTKAKGKMKPERGVGSAHRPAAAAIRVRVGGGCRERRQGERRGATVSGKVAVFGFTGDGAGRVQQAVISALRTHGLQVNTTLRPVDSTEQYREMGTMLQLAAYIEGAVGGDGSRATVHVRSGVTGRRIASIRFSGDRSGLAADVSSKLWPKTGSKLARLCQRGGQAAQVARQGAHAHRRGHAARDHAPGRRRRRSQAPAHRQAQGRPLGG